MIELEAKDLFGPWQQSGFLKWAPPGKIVANPFSNRNDSAYTGYGKYLQVSLLAALNQLVEGRRSEVGVDVGRVQPLQGLHDDLLQDEWTEHAFCRSNAELVHIVHSWQDR